MKIERWLPLFLIHSCYGNTSTCTDTRGESAWTNKATPTTREKKKKQHTGNSRCRKSTLHWWTQTVRYSVVDHRRACTMIHHFRASRRVPSESFCRESTTSGLHHPEAVPFKSPARFFILHFSFSTFFYGCTFSWPACMCGMIENSRNTVRRT